MSKGNEDKTSIKEDSASGVWKEEGADGRVCDRNPGRAAEALCRVDPVGVAKRPHTHFKKSCKML